MGYSVFGIALFSENCNEICWLASYGWDWRLDLNQSLNLQVLVAQRFGKPEDVQALVKRLLEQQESDGGWSQMREVPKEALKDYEGKKTDAAPKPEKRPSDALATGQTLYALSVAGVDPQQAAIQRALGYLVQSQTKMVRGGSRSGLRRTAAGHSAIMGQAGQQLE